MLPVCVLRSGIAGSGRLADDLMFPELPDVKISFPFNKVGNNHLLPDKLFQRLPNIDGIGRENLRFEPHGRPLGAAGVVNKIQDAEKEEASRQRQLHYLLVSPELRLDGSNACHVLASLPLDAMRLERMQRSGETGGGCPPQRCLVRFPVHVSFTGESEATPRGDHAASSSSSGSNTGREWT